MRIPGNPYRRSVSANMTPMIDVVFLLIIFFLVSSHLARQENRLPLDLPVASTFGPVDPQAAPLTVSVDAEANWRVGGKVVEMEQLRDALSTHRDRQGASASVRIRTDAAIAYRYVEPLLRESAKAGITDVLIAVHKETTR